MGNENIGTLMIEVAKQRNKLRQDLTKKQTLSRDEISYI